MVYNVIGAMSGSSLDGLDIVLAQLTEIRGQWTYEIKAADTLPYPADWMQRLSGATTLPAADYLVLHSDYGRYTGQQILAFIERHGLQHQVHFIASHGHTAFHLPAMHTTAQLGDGAAIAAITSLPVISDLRAIDLALGGQGAPIVPIGEKLLFPDFQYWLNLGGIANVSAITGADRIAFDICPANRVLNALSLQMGHDYDEGGGLAAAGEVNEVLLSTLQQLPYYALPYPKSLANSFGIDTVLPLLTSSGLSVPDQLRTYTEHIAQQIAQAIEPLHLHADASQAPFNMLVSGGGAFNTFLLERIDALVSPFRIDLVVPDAQTVKFKEALIMALIGALRWRQEDNVLSSVTGASRDSIGGALWMGSH
ncbi:anhydro-N-acetylmuramic acid kinase [Chitinophaga costaii]|uniref:Anhydro-N-acetylmuramic acid kinase n=1 Tax=Chitinophaga costaii TaxID=1335309 RepID=A0A1C4G496_9BACT|nr:anhydro-N-acetylmuramic acid kinase [Chitinophaga costaii]PUZ22041.1 anhydro-N-acetylmuramic acid kinase [Chitinophaga costaii]SCC62944.1 anhydro-N-acetylmuramic acid kinase [Chitinophaga costaii]